MAAATLEQLLGDLGEQAGPRGFTFAGRAMQPGETLQQALGRFPMGETEYGGIAMQAPELLKSLSLLIPGMIKGRPNVPRSVPRLATKPTFDEQIAKINQIQMTGDPATRWNRELGYKLQLLDAEKAPDEAYKRLFSTGTRDLLKRGETWRSRALRAAMFEE